MKYNPLIKALQEATSLHQAGDLIRAESIYRSILKKDPRLVPALLNLGSLLRQRGRHLEAIGLYKHALTYEPTNAGLLSNLGRALHQIGLAQEAIEVLQKAIVCDPKNDIAHDNLGHIHSRMEHYDEAAAMLEKAVTLNPRNANAWNNLAGVHLAQCRVEEAIRCYRKVVEMNPNFAMAYSNILFTMNFSPHYTAEQMAREHRVWNDHYSASVASEVIRHPPRDPDKKRLRVGFVSHDLLDHPVGRFLAPLFRARDSRDWEAVCYSDVIVPDRQTDWLRGRSDQWRDTTGLTDAELAQLAHKDRIDILIDLAGHTGGNRLLAFARKPAPIQASWIGYFNTTGLAAMDYLIADRTCVPESMEHLYVEKIIRLPNDFLCYDPPAVSPPVSPLPALERGHVTFCSFNQLAKVSDDAVRCWGELLQRIPTARLIIRGKALNDESVRKRFGRKLIGLGISGDRFDLLPKTSFRNYLSTYHEADIALDSFPFVGGTTTCDSLWMGVPVVTFIGDRFCSRHSASHLINAGLPEMVAEKIDGYLNLAVDLAGNLERLASIRASLREKMAKSPLCDAELFASNFSKALRSMWNGSG